jgi:hypothetical protein
MSAELQITKAEILAQLKKEGVTNLDELATFLIQKTHKNGDESGPVIADAIIYKHGFVSH